MTEQDHPCDKSKLECLLDEQDFMVIFCTVHYGKYYNGILICSYNVFLLASRDQWKARTCLPASVVCGRKRPP